MEKVNKFLHLIDGTAEKDVDLFLSNERTFDEYKEYILKYHKICLTLPKEIKSTATFGIFEVDFTEIVNILDKQANQFKSVIVDQMHSAYLAFGKK